MLEGDVNAWTEMWYDVLDSKWSEFHFKIIINHIKSISGVVTDKDAR